MQQRFQIHPTAEVLTPQSDGTQTLWRALSEGGGLYADQSGGLEVRKIPDGQPWMWCESSGSTGRPKIIRRRPASWIASFAVNKKLFQVTSAARYAVLGHLGHSLSLYAAVEALHLGAGLALLTGVRPDRQGHMIGTLAISHLYATPSQLRLLLASSDVTFPAVAEVICGGGSLTPDLRQMLQFRCPNATVTEFFGASETSFIAMSDPETSSGAVGRAYPGVDLKIIGSTDQNPVGEIAVQSPYLFDGYEADGTTETRLVDGYLAFGELGWCDAAGQLYLCGRRSRMVNVADQKVYPEAIEAVLMGQAGVDLAAVLTWPDDLRGHRVVAALQGAASAKKLREACRAALGPHAVPREFRRFDKVPLLPAGKPDLERLRQIWTEGQMV